MVRTIVPVVVLVLAAAFVAVSVGGTAVADTAGTSNAGDVQQQVTLTLQVQDRVGNSIGGADIEVSYDGGTATAESRSNGQALVDVPQGADVTIRIDHPNFIQNHPLQVQNVESETIDVTVFRRATAVVEVTDEEGSDLDGAQVTLTKFTQTESAASGETGDDGTYQSPDIEAGEYDVDVLKRGYLQKRVEMEVTPESSGTTVVLEEASASMSVRVVDDHFSNPQPVEEARVSILHGGQELVSGRTDDRGRRSLSEGVNGQYTVRVSKEGYQSDEKTIFLGEQDRSLEFSINRERSLSLEAVNERLPAGESVLVRVHNAYGEPVEGATIERDGEAVGTTDANGELQVEIPGAGNFELVASQDDVTSSSVLVEGIQERTETPTPTPTETPTPTPTPTPTDTPTPTPEGDEPLPGFGSVAALVAILAGLAVIALRRRP